MYSKCSLGKGKMTPPDLLWNVLQVGYLAGSNGQPLLPQYLSDLDSALIPVIHSGACQLSEGPVVMELIFYILEIIS